MSEESEAEYAAYDQIGESDEEDRDRLVAALREARDELHDAESRVSALEAELEDLGHDPELD